MPAPTWPREVDVRVRLVIESMAAITLTVPEPDLHDLEAIRRRAVEAVSSGDYSSDLETYSAHVTAELVYRLDARCKVRPPRFTGDTTPWCRIHDSSMRRDDASRCYDAPHPSRHYPDRLEPAEYGR